MNTLLLLLSTMVLQAIPEFPHPEFVVKCYPETVMPGDTLYTVVFAKNPHAESIYVFDSYSLTAGDVKIRLREHLPAQLLIFLD